MGEPESNLQRKFANGIPQSITILEGLISRLQEKKEDIESQEIHEKSEIIELGSRRVFIVHGHDDSAKEMMARFITSIELEPIILHEQANEGKTIIEKFESYTNVDFAVILLTPDDLGTAKDKPENLKSRARQNVIFELGFFIGRLGRKRVVALYQGDLEVPSEVDPIG